MPEVSHPLHLAIIPDGNRRWAKEHKLEAVWKGHEIAIENFRTLTEWCRKNPRISVLTVWCFSTENWKRDEKEVTMLMTMLEDYLRKEGESLLKENTRFLHSGRRDRLPKSLVKLIEETEEKTKDCTAFTLHLAVDYGGKDEILRAMNKLLTTHYSLPTQPNTPITEESLRASLDQPSLPDIDIILRSSGEYRTSNFFLFQAAYSEWIFSQKYFPDITMNDLENAVKEYERRKRRFGG